MTSITRRRRSKGPDTRIGVEDAITEAMARLMARGQTFTAVSVEDLSEEAGIARSTFYMHFRDKGELVRRLMKRVTAELAAATNLWFEHPHPESRDSIDAMLRSVTQVHLKFQAIMQAISETTAYDPDVADMFRETMSRLSASTREAIQRAQAAGTAKAEVTPEVADALTWMVERCSQKLLTVQKPAQRERMIQALGHVIWCSLFDTGAAEKPVKSRA